MKIYFTSPIKDIDSIKPFLKEIYQIISKLGYAHADDFLSRLNNKEDFYSKLEEGGKEAHEQYFNDTINILKNADINIFECSIPSLGVGFQIEKSIAYNKPTIVLYYSKHKPHFIAGTQNEKLFIREYNDNNLSSVLEDTIDEARHASDKRFNFFISPSLLTYLEEVSTKAGITKSAFIRQLILEHKRKRK